MTPLTSTQQKAAHTPTPWRQASTEKADEYTCRILEDSRSLAPYRIATTHVRQDGGFDYEEAEANAAFIVRACNSHEALVEALGNLLSFCEKAHHDNTILTKARAAFSQATA